MNLHCNYLRTDSLFGSKLEMMQSSETLNMIEAKVIHSLLLFGPKVGSCSPPGKKSADAHGGGSISF